MKPVTRDKKVENLSRYAGQWVALVAGEVVAYNDTLKNLMAEVEALGVSAKASVFLVPRKDEGPYVLIL